MRPTETFVPPPAQITLGALGGLRAAGVVAGIKASGRKDVALLVADRPTPVAAVFTTNAFSAAPVRVSREHLERSRGRFCALAINAGNANACTGERGLRDARAMCDRVASLVGCEAGEVLVASTGVIGVPLPIERVLSGLDDAFAALSTGDTAARCFLDAIQTTDAFPKEAGSRGPGFAVAGVAKGAGMIEPDMATMLAVVATDATFSSTELAALAPGVAASSFNSIHVDSHASTNDSFFLCATGARAASPAAAGAITEVSRRLAWLIARDGEGATKVATIVVRGAKDDRAASDIARRVAHSALVRTALFGNDPNWGRFVSAAGNSPGADVSRLSCRLQGTVVFDGGEPTRFDRAAAAASMATDDVCIELDLRSGSGEARVLTSDLGYRYVEVNAEYTT